MKRNIKGLTLVEILTLIAIIGIVLSILVPTVQVIVTKAGKEIVENKVRDTATTAKVNTQKKVDEVVETFSTIVRDLETKIKNTSDEDIKDRFGRVKRKLEQIGDKLFMNKESVTVVERDHIIPRNDPPDPSNAREEYERMKAKRENEKLKRELAELKLQLSSKEEEEVKTNRYQ